MPDVVFCCTEDNSYLNRNNFPLVLKSAGENVHEQHLAVIQWLFVLFTQTLHEKDSTSKLSEHIHLNHFSEQLQLRSLISNVKAWHVGGHPCRERVQAQTLSYQNRSITHDGGTANRRDTLRSVEKYCTA